MRRTLPALTCVLTLLTAAAAGARAQEPAKPPSADTTATDSARVRPDTAAPASRPDSSAGRSWTDQLYYGGTLTLGFSGATTIGIFPMVGYKLSPKASVGAEVGYEYVDYNGSGGSTSSYGASLLTRYRITPRFFAAGEFQEINFEVPHRGGTTREWVPFVLLGGGIVQQAGQRASAYVELLWDVLQDDRSPYDSGVPRVSLGVAVGF